MPLRKGVGYGEYTEEKQKHFAGLVNLHVRATKGILGRRKADKHYHYIDLNAGPGRYKDGNGRMYTGSPLLFLDKAMGLSVPFKAFLVEIEKTNCEDLNDWTTAYRAYGDISIIHGDNEDVAPELLNGSSDIPRYGMVYSDPTGSAPPFDMLADLSKLPAYQRIDFVIYLAATNYKRFRRAEHCPVSEFLIEKLRKIGKTTWIVREPTGAHQFTFLIGTNWRRFPDWKKQGFYNVNTPEGEALLALLNFTQEEQRLLLAE
jgi:three-Cys-motif partner protein